MSENQSLLTGVRDLPFIKTFIIIFSIIYCIGLPLLIMIIKYPVQYTRLDIFKILLMVSAIGFGIYTISYVFALVGVGVKFMTEDKLPLVHIFEWACVINVANMTIVFLALVIGEFYCNKEISVRLAIFYLIATNTSIMGYGVIQFFRKKIIDYRKHSIVD
jgi:hypothetical protein